MKLPVLDADGFYDALREVYQEDYSHLDFFDYLQEFQKLYTEFTDSLHHLRQDFSGNRDEILKLVLKYVDLELLEFWSQTINIALPNKKMNAEEFTSKILKPNLDYISRILMKNSATICNGLDDKIFDYRHLLKIGDRQEQEVEGFGKITINGNVQLWGFIFNELISKGFISAPKHNGKSSYAKFARQLLDNFEFTSHPTQKQPSENYLTKALKENKYSLDKQELFKIPHIKNAND